MQFKIELGRYRYFFRTITFFPSAQNILRSFPIGQQRLFCWIVCVWSVDFCGEYIHVKLSFLDDEICVIEFLWTMIMSSWQHGYYLKGWDNRKTATSELWEDKNKTRLIEVIMHNVALRYWYQSECSNAQTHILPCYCSLHHTLARLRSSSDVMSGCSKVRPMHGI